ncbi:cold shock domain-containing protein [Candidatus Woesearchaeota archaeon]|nr:cold shock domain-containing protein [Candidatus Woesearchaeota archaeon]
MEGKVKFFNRTKGFGFIVGDDGRDYFVHHSALNRGTFLRENDKVSFDAAETERGWQARNVTLLQKGSELAGAPQGSQDQASEGSNEESAEEPAAEEEEQEA